MVALKRARQGWRCPLASCHNNALPTSGGTESMRWLCSLTYGLMATVVVLLLVGLAAAQPAERRVALVIGNGQYQYVPRLANPTNDARLIAETLTALGFTLVGGQAQLDLDKTALDRTVQEFSKVVQGAGVALFYYAGHGVQVRGPIIWCRGTPIRPGKRMSIFSSSMLTSCCARWSWLGRGSIC